jgi:hypothetical protein
VSNALQGNVQSAKFLIALADKHVPAHLTLEELMEGRSVFEFTDKERARFSREAMIKHLESDQDKEGADGDGPAI